MTPDHHQRPTDSATSAGEKHTKPLLKSSISGLRSGPLSMFGHRGRSSATAGPLPSKPSSGGYCQLAPSISFELNDKAMTVVTTSECQETSDEQDRCLQVSALNASSTTGCTMPDGRQVASLSLPKGDVHTKNSSSSFGGNASAAAQEMMPHNSFKRRFE